VPAAVGALQAAQASGGPGSPEDSALAAARAAFVALDSAARVGDWIGFGRAMESLRRALGGRGERKP
jgi:hypothetical protein